MKRSQIIGVTVVVTLMISVPAVLTWIVGAVAVKVALLGAVCALFGGIARWSRDWLVETWEAKKKTYPWLKGWPNLADQATGALQFLAWYFGICTLWYAARGTVEIAIGVYVVDVRTPWHWFPTLPWVAALFHTSHVLFQRTLCMPKGNRVDLRAAQMRSASAYTAGVICLIACASFIVWCGCKTWTDVQDALAVRGSAPYQASDRVAAASVAKTKPDPEDVRIALTDADKVEVDKVLANRRKKRPSSVRKIREKVAPKVQAARNPAEQPDFTKDGVTPDPGWNGRGYVSNN